MIEGPVPGVAWRRSSAPAGIAALTLLAALAGAPPAKSAGTGKVIVSNEKSSTLTILDLAGKQVDTVKSCARPRGMKFTRDRSGIFVGCADDNTIALYELATMKLVRRFRNVNAPETFALHPDGRRLYISNEDDSEATVLDVESGETVAHVLTGPEPEGVAIAKDGRRAFVASEVANLVHVIDTATNTVIKEIQTGTRPRRFAMTPDGRELWVSAELSGQVDIIDLESLAAKGVVNFEIRVLRREQITPVDLLISKDGSRAYVALGRANHVAVVDVASRKVLEYILVGQRPWGLMMNDDESRLWVANGLSDDVSIIDVKTSKVLVSVPVGEVPYAILIDDR